MNNITGPGKAFHEKTSSMNEQGSKQVKNDKKQDPIMKIAGQTLANKENSSDFQKKEPSQIWNQVKPGISKQAKLFKDSRELFEKSSKEPLQHFDPSSNNALDVYMNDEIVFKPGEMAAVKAKVTYGLMRLAGIEDAVVPAKSGKATVISRKDQSVNLHNPKEHEVLNNNYELMDLGNNNVYLVDQEELEVEDKILLEKEGDTLTLDGKACRLVPDKSGYRLEFTENNLEKDISLKSKFILVGEDRDNTFLVSSKRVIAELKAGTSAKIDGITYKVTVDPQDDQYLLLHSKDSKEKPLTFQKLQDFSSKQVESESDVESDISDVESDSESESETVKEVWVNVDHMFPFNEDESELAWEGQTYSVKSSDGQFTVKPPRAESDYRDKKFALVKEEDSNFLVELSALPELEKGNKIINSHDKSFVKRNGQLYEVIREDNEIKVVGKNIRGMVQAKIQNTFTGSGSKPLDITLDTPERALFYDRIPMDKFEDAFLATLLLRPQDGKISNLKESNVLFTLLPDKEGQIDAEHSPLMPVLIDLDETLPSSNESLEVKSYTSINKPTKIVQSVRFGLMGFPHAHRILSAEERAHMESMIDRVVNQKEELDKYLKPYTKNGKVIQPAHAKALDEAIEKLAEFRTDNRADDWTLADLCFHVLPAYKKQWEFIGDRMSPEEKALVIGYNDIKEIETALDRRGKGIK